MAGGNRRRVAGVLLAGVLLVGAAGPAQAQMSCDPCAVGVVFDGPWERNEELRVGFEEEIEALAAPRFRVVFPAAARRVADWTLEGSQAAVEALLGDLAADAAGAARRNLALVTDAYEQGVLSILDLIDAQNAALVAEQSAATAVYDYLIDLMDAHRASGRFGLFMEPAELAAFTDRLRAFFRDAGYEPRARP